MWLIVGEGALSGLLATELQRQHQPVTVLTRQQQPARPVYRSDLNQHFQLQSWQPELYPLAHMNGVIAAIKAYQVESFLQQWRAWQPLSIPLVLSYNGMLDNETELLPTNSVQWVTTHGAFRDRSMHSEQADTLTYAGHGEHTLGWQTPRPGKATPVIDLFETISDVHWSDHIAPQRWQKLAINCLINPFTVIHQCRNGALLELHIESLQQQVAEEISALAKTYAIELIPQQLIAKARQVMLGTAANRSSMLSDVERGVRSEIDYLAGFVSRQSEARGLTAPANQQLWQQVLEHEQSNRV